MSTSAYIDEDHESEKYQFQMCFFSDWHVIKLYSYNTNDYLPK